ncbi:Zn-ribbon domain-containing OB-fold protein [Secundilactobacillus folii]|uniref:DUF35 domain-containing protein n=1 Tax=Secundilactobacillus folii TaxID=2678357 RepID=A0A7X2XW47_9LACO|nr:zinc ribbon domain-containing protein [Secundilactobacillus folii]MTV82759.1 hypothetical protein [Secundilactobacillus folii]
MKPDLTVKRYYQSLEEGKILGRKCEDCGNVEWPPVYSCNKCGGHHTDWIELSGKGEVVEFVPAIGALVQNKDWMPYAVGHVRLQEGPIVMNIVEGISQKNADELHAKLPIPVKAKIVKMATGFSRVIFEVVSH